MKYEELKEKIYALADINTRLYYIKIFEQYEKENQASETNIEQEIFELSCFRKKFGECLDDQRNDLNLLKKHILDLQDELVILKRDLKFQSEQEKPKQERFYYERYRNGYFLIGDRQDDNLGFNEAQVIEICKVLNAMEGSGK